MDRKRDKAPEPEPGNLICSICLEPLSAETGIECTEAALERCPDKSAVVALHCGHMFHMICLEQNYLARDDYGEERCCPLCKKELRTEPLVPIIRLFPTVTDEQPKPPPVPCSRCDILKDKLDKLKLRMEDHRQRRQLKLQKERNPDRAVLDRGGQNRPQKISGDSDSDPVTHRSTSNNSSFVGEAPEREGEYVFIRWKVGGKGGYYYSVDEEW